MPRSQCPRSSQPARRKSMNKSFQDLLTAARTVENPPPALRTAIEAVEDTSTTRAANKSWRWPVRALAEKARLSSTMMPSCPKVQTTGLMWRAGSGWTSVGPRWTKRKRSKEMKRILLRTVDAALESRDPATLRGTFVQERHTFRGEDYSVYGLPEFEPARLYYDGFRLIRRCPYPACSVSEMSRGEANGRPRSGRRDLRRVHEVRPHRATRGQILIAPHCTGSFPLPQRKNVSP